MEVWMRIRPLALLVLLLLSVQQASSQQPPRECCPPHTTVIKFMTDHDVPPNVGISLPPYRNVDGHRFINFFVQFSQKDPAEKPVDLGFMFAFDANGTMGARRYVNLESNVAGPQPTNFIEVSGAGSWHGSPQNISSYTARSPVMGPWVQCSSITGRTRRGR